MLRLALAIALMFLTAWEIFWRERGFVPSVADDPVRWSIQRRLLGSRRYRRESFAPAFLDGRWPRRPPWIVRRDCFAGYHSELDELERQAEILVRRLEGERSRELSGLARDA